MLPLLFLLVTQSAEVETFAVGDLQRKALVVRPASDRLAPIVFAFHGHGGGMHQARRSFGIDKEWPEALVVYPQGLPTKGRTDPKGEKAGWQQNEGEYGDRDLAFFDKMLASLKGYDEKRIYVMGHSNGGRFTYLLWSKRGNRLAAVAPSASPGALLLLGAPKLPAFIIAGRKDEIVSFASQQLSINAARRLLKVDASRATVDGNVRIEPGAGRFALATYIYPEGHRFASAAVKPMVEFFKTHPRE